MTEHAVRYSPELDPKIESEVHTMLIETANPRIKIDSYIDTCLATEHLAQRFFYLRSVSEHVYSTQNPQSSFLDMGRALRGS
jgi:hypothetical protein